MNRRRLTGALAIGTTASLAIWAGSASATSSTITLACDKATFTYRTFGPPPQSLATYAITVDGAPFTSGTLTPAGPLSVFDVPLNLQGTHAVTASTHGTPYNAFSSASATVDCPVPAPPLASPPAAVAPVAVEPLPRLVAPRKVTTPQKPRCALPKGAGMLWYVKRGCAIPPRFLAKRRVWAVTGEYLGTGSHRAVTALRYSQRASASVSPASRPRRPFAHILAQGPSPASIVSSLLVQVPALAGDTPYASSIQQGAGGRSSSGGVSAKERGRLVPGNIPGHPWASKSTAPGRGVACSVAWRSGRLTVRVLYSASRGRSSTSVSVR